MLPDFCASLNFCASALNFWYAEESGSHILRTRLAMTLVYLTWPLLSKLSIKIVQRNFVDCYNISMQYFFWMLAAVTPS